MGEQASPNSVSGHAGLKAGDVITSINNADVTGFTHEQARGEIIRAGNDIDLIVRRGGGEVAPTAAPAPEPEEAPPRMSVSDAGEGEGSYREVQPKTYKILESELNEGAAASGGGGRPASIFDKRRQKRSEYTKTDHSGYLKAYGQQK